MINIFSLIRFIRNASLILIIVDIIKDVSAKYAPVIPRCPLFWLIWGIMFYSAPVMSFLVRFCLIRGDAFVRAYLE